MTRFKSKRALIIAGAVVSLVFILVLAFLMRPAYAVSAKTLSYVKDAVARQQEIEQQLNAAYLTGKYTFASPLIVQDPYQTAPLTALLIFDTPENSQISIHVPGKSPQSAVDFTFPGYQQHHEIPVYGLYGATLNHVTVSMKTQNGVSAQTQIDLQTEALPDTIPTFTIDNVNPAKYSPGFNFAFQEQKPVFDIDGKVRWYSSRASFSVFTKLDNGHFLFTYSIDNDDKATIVMEQDLLGRIYAVYNIPDAIHHDIYELPNGNLLMASSDLRSNTIEDYLIEVDRNNGHIVRSFDLKTIFDQDRQFVIGMSKKDWLHLNSIFYDPVDKTILISSFSQSAVIKMTYPGMQIKWILGPHDNWSKKYQPYLLTPVGSNFEWPWSQHHATLYGPHDPGNASVDVLLFNNGQFHSFDISQADLSSKWYSNVIHYRIDEASMTIKQVWEYGQENGPATFSGTYGSAYLLSNGDVLGTWGDIYKDAKGHAAISSSSANGTTKTRIIEVDPNSNEVVFTCSVPATSTYRTLRAGFYDGFSEENSYLSTKLNNTTGNDLADRSVLAWRDVRRWTITPTLAWLKNVRNQILAKIKR